MAFIEVDRYSAVVAVVAVPADPQGEIYQVYCWDPNLNAYGSGAPVVTIGGEGGARVFAQNPPTAQVSARYYIEAVVNDPDGIAVEPYFPLSYNLSGSYDSARGVWVGEVSESIAPGSYERPTGGLLAWDLRFAVSKAGSYTLEAILYAERV